VNRAVNHGWRWTVCCALLVASCGHTREVGDGTTPTVSETSTCTMVAPSTTTSTSTTTTSTTIISMVTTMVATTTVPPPPPPTTAPPTTALPPTIAPPTTRPLAASMLVWRLPISQKVVAITFDAGSDLGFTGQVLDTLSAYGVRASFGITGDWADDHPDAVRRMAVEGHQVMNHSYAHLSFTGASAPNPLLTTAERQAELAKADATLSALIGCTTKPFFRPPYGDTNASVLADVGAAGYGFTVMWTVDSGGWQGLTAEQIVERITTRVEPGAILAFHVGSASQDSAALPRIIQALQAAGYSFVTLAGAYGL